MSDDKKPCEHIEAFWKYCSDNYVEAEGCDCNGFVVCAICKIRVSNNGRRT